MHRFASRRTKMGCNEPYVCVYTMYGKSILIHYFQHLYLILCSVGKTVGYFKCDLTVILFRNDGENRN